MSARLSRIDLREPLLVALFAIPIGLLAGLEPVFAIGAALGLGFVIFAIADLSAGLAVFVFITFMAQIPNIAGPAVSFVKLAGLLLAVSWIGSLAIGQRSKGNFFSAHPGLSYALALFLALNGLSYLWAADGGIVLDSLYRYALNVSLFLIVYTAVQDERHLRWVLLAFLLGAGFGGLYGIANPPSDEFGPSRIAGTIGNANELATVLVAGTAIAGGLAAATKDILARAAYIGIGAVCLLAMFMTASRGGLVGLGAMLVAAILIGGRHRARLGVGALIVAIVAVAYFAAIAPPQARERITQQNGGTGRIDLWTVAKRIIDDKPLTGVGAGNFPVSSVEYLLLPGPLERSDLIIQNPQPVHNTYLEVFAEVGIPAGLLFLGLISATLAMGIKARVEFRKRGLLRLQALALAVVLALVGTLAADIFVSDEYSKQLWLLLGLCPALLLIARTTAPVPGSERALEAELEAAAPEHSPINVA